MSRVSPFKILIAIALLACYEVSEEGGNGRVMMIELHYLRRAQYRAQDYPVTYHTHTEAPAEDRSPCGLRPSDANAPLMRVSSCKVRDVQQNVVT